jgi:hypothetical protein
MTVGVENYGLKRSGAEEEIKVGVYIIEEIAKEFGVGKY